MHLNALKEILVRLAHFLCRLQTQRKVYQLQDNKVIELDFAEIARNMKKFDVQHIEESVFLGEDLELQVRLFIYSLPDAVYRERLRKLNRNAKKQGRELTVESKAHAQLTLFITSAPADAICIETAWKVYTLRWQIELTFKVWKSIWKIDKVKKVKQERLECYIWAKLFIIVVSWHVLWFISKMLRQLYGESLSFYKAMKTIVFYIARFRQMIIGGSAAAGEYLAELLTLSKQKHLLEKKKSANYSPEILFGTVTVSSAGNVISVED